jgi:hypothetical protein
MATNPPSSPLPGYQSYERQPARITGVVRTKPGVWRIAWGVCLGLFLFTAISSLIVLALALVLGATVGSGFDVDFGTP